MVTKYGIAKRCSIWYLRYDGAWLNEAICASFVVFLKEIRDDVARQELSSN